MGIEIEELPPQGPPIFTGKALSIRFPDIDVPTPDGKIRRQPVYVTTFPHWIFRVHLNDDVFEIKGEDLQVGMPLEFNGQYLFITGIEKIDYHGMEIPTAPIARPPKTTDNLQKYSFKRIFYDDNRTAWEVTCLSQ